jgi:hypothetical protein
MIKLSIWLTSSIPASKPFEAPEFGQVSGILNVGGRRVAMDNDRLVLHECPISFIVSPDALRHRVGGRAAEHTPEHFQGNVDPVILIDRSRSITLDTRDEQNNQDALASAPEGANARGRASCAVSPHSRSI